MPELFAYTDGACSGNPGPGGWGVLLVARKDGETVRERELSGGEAMTTNNRMELLAAISALEALTQPAALTVVTDSAYVKNGVTSWLAGWKRNGWKTADRKEVKNTDLWQRLDAARARHRVTWEWIKGHAGHPRRLARLVRCHAGAQTAPRRRREAVPLTPSALKARVVAEAKAVGFSAARITTPDAIPEAAARLAEYVGEGRHGQMQWLAERMAWRGAPDALWPEARSIIMLAELYTPDADPLATHALKDRGTISVHARGRDYHKVVKSRLKQLGRWLIDLAGGEIKVFVDTAPVMEKPLAQAAGLGWQGKHSVVLSRDLGSFFFLGAIFTTLELPPDAPETEHCGTCTACLDACPTNAFVAPFKLDARCCITYLTIEHKGPVDPELRPLMGNRIYGCDDCLAVCPWNKFAKAASEMKYAAREDLTAPRLADLAKLDDAGFRAMFSGSPVKRIGRDRFVRNVLYAIGNSGLPTLAPVAAGLVDDADAAVADAARWALGRLAHVS